MNKNLLIGVGAVVLLLLGLGGYFVMSNRSAEPVEPVEESLENEAISIKPEEIGLELEATPNKKQVKFIISKAIGITALEYELSYEADSTGGTDDGDGGGRISRGVAGEDELDGTEESYESKLLDLGSCSSGTCRYDTGVTDVQLLLKITKDDGKVYAVEDTLEL